MASMCGKGEAKKLSRALQRPSQGIPKTFPRQGPFFLVPLEVASVGGLVRFNKIELCPRGFAAKPWQVFTRYTLACPHPPRPRPPAAPPEPPLERALIWGGGPQFDSRHSAAGPMPSPLRAAPRIEQRLVIRTVYDALRGRALAFNLELLPRSGRSPETVVGNGPPGRFLHALQ
jgi:hypothetical protein